jgi:hypothetical protein
MNNHKIKDAMITFYIYTKTELLATNPSKYWMGLRPKLCGKILRRLSIKKIP